MHSASFLRIARVFATVLLLWTGAEVCDYGLCSDHRDALNGFAHLAIRPGDGDEQSAIDTVDCFCCSHVVDVRTPFRVVLRYDVAWTVTDSSAGQSQLISVPLYHPPLA